jgi:REP element-mobilizing transposase RayT
MFREERDSNLERVEFELRAVGVRKDQSNPLRSGIHTRGYLPHVKREGASYFVTFRLGDSLPQEVFFKIVREKAARLARLLMQAPAGKSGSTASVSDSKRDIDRDFFRKMEECLDRRHGDCWLRRPAIALQVGSTLQSLDGLHYLLKAWVVMPNHVHVVLWPTPNHTLSEILKAWKGHSAREANKLLGRLGQKFWQRESFDHWIRCDAELDRCCRYVCVNPVKARLCKAPEDWPWSSAWRGRRGL